MEYAEFIANKMPAVEPSGFDVPDSWLPSFVKPIQLDGIRWALRMGRGAICYDTGLGKTLIELLYGLCVVRYTGRPFLLAEPLAVGPQIIREAERFGLEGIQLARSQADVTGPGVWLTNYEKMHKFEAAEFGGVGLGEASILKSHDGKTRTALIEKFSATPFRLCLTATPAPNDHEELGNYAEFLGIMSRTEMLASYFVHDSGDTSEWRLKGHAEKPFWEWVASWALLARRPSDLGHSDDGYDLPPLHIHEHMVRTGVVKDDRLFAVSEVGLTGQRQARRTTLEMRVAKAAELANAYPGPVVVWCELNDEGDALEAAIPDAVQVAGKDSDEDKVDRLEGFASGKYRVLISKTKITGHGLNWQHCRKSVYVGLSNSFEAFYQSYRRFWRYGQTEEVHLDLITSDLESAVIDTIKEKQANHDEMFEQALTHTRAVNRVSLRGTVRMSDEYQRDVATGPGWELHLGDCVDVGKKLADDSVGMIGYSPPFASLYTYSNQLRDMGNCRDAESFMKHFKYLVAEMYRVLMPGRMMWVHCMNLPSVKERDGFIGIRDFRGDLVREFQAAGFIFHSEVMIRKDPVVAMMRTKALGLLHKQVKKDSCMSRQSIPDYVVVMRKPGKNPEPVAGRFEEYIGTEGPAPPTVVGDGMMGPRIMDEDEADRDRERYSIEVWQRYAESYWGDIDQNRVLSYAGARDASDERHICPLQLDVIERCLDLWSNPGDLVWSPFAGVGSEGYCAIKAGRRFVGSELKQSYWEQARLHLTRAVTEAAQKNLFDDAPDELEEAAS